MKQLYELLQGAGLLTFVIIAAIIAATIETGKQNRRDEKQPPEDP